MIIARTIDELNAAMAQARAQKKRIGFVPTMGALHDGHLSLVRLAHKYCEFCVVSIFVNPTQFAPHEDFDSYPRTEEADSKRLSEAGVDVLFMPTRAVIYPDGEASDIKAGAPAQGLESDFRPHFFDGVVNVVHRLFAAVQPDISVFGEKDFQQLQVIRDMVDQLDMKIEVIGAPIARDEAGLALSSRNAYLNADEIEIARKLNVILRTAAKDDDITQAKQALLSAGFDKVDYVEKRWNRILGAAWLGRTRLIDNVSG